MDIDHLTLSEKGIGYFPFLEFFSEHIGIVESTYRGIACLHRWFARLT
ncbi:MAG TPA: hypothetical protein VJJ79_00615 [Candidatus Nanoarchaeia archaeon]|nr:hypothetical protein [Candidatus Nanoarchaeia archaeon]